MPASPKRKAAPPGPLKTPVETQAILDGLYGQHPNATTELDFTTPFELLVATILSAQSSDKLVNQVTPKLFPRYPNAASLVASTAAELEPQIVATGFFRQKAKALLGMARALVETHGGDVPADMDALTALPGVGRKTANVVLGHAFGIPGLPVDRHVLRVANRLGIAQAATPEEVETQLCAAIPREQWTLASSTLILHGRRVCRPTQPLCAQCAAVEPCVFAAEMRAAVAPARPPHAQPPRRKPATAGRPAAKRMAAGTRTRAAKRKRPGRR
jgi:endonuclease-3